MSKLLEQVKEIQRKAHVCPECEGEGKARMYPYWDIMLCPACKGTKQVPAPDIDKLCAFIEETALLCYMPCTITDGDVSLCEYCDVEDACKILFNGLPEVEKDV